MILRLVPWIYRPKPMGLRRRPAPQYDRTTLYVLVYSLNEATSGFDSKSKSSPGIFAVQRFDSEATELGRAYVITQPRFWIITSCEACNICRHVITRKSRRDMHVNFKCLSYCLKIADELLATSTRCIITRQWPTRIVMNKKFTV